MDQELAGKVAIVTGGSGGIGGPRWSLRRAGGEGGHRRRRHRAGRGAGRGDRADPAFRRTDVSERQRRPGAVDFAVAHFGGLHIMFNNAGISGAFTRFLDDDFCDFQRVMGVNLLGVMVGSQRAARHMAKNGGGSIINNSSIGGVMPGSGVTTYRAAKAAVIHFTRSIAVELGPKGIRANASRPGHIATGMTTTTSDA